jgi:hypothetical protein
VPRLQAGLGEQGRGRALVERVGLFLHYRVQLPVPRSLRP